MSMILSLVGLSDTNISRVLADPPLVWQVIAPADPEMYEAARAAQKPNLLSRLFGKGKSSNTALRLELSSSEGGSVEYVHTLRGFLRETANANLGMVVYLA